MIASPPIDDNKPVGTIRETFRYSSFMRRAWYDLFNVLVLSGLAVALLPGWSKLGGGNQWDIANLLASPLLPATTGFLLAWRYGTVDLSLWATMGVSGLVAAGLICAGLSPTFSCLAGAATGLVVGVVNALLVHFIRRIPGVVLTAAVGGAILLGCWLVMDSRAVIVPERTFDAWVLAISDAHRDLVNEALEAEGKKTVTGQTLEGPLATLRMLIVFGAWAAVMVGLMIADAKTRNIPRPFARWWARPAGLIACGALAGISGVAWLIDQGRAPVPTRLVDALDIPIAVIMAGVFLLQGRGRTMLICVLLPVCLVLVNIWTQAIWPVTAHGYAMQLVLLGAMVVGIQTAFLWAMERRTWARPLAWVACGLSLAGLGLIASTTRLPYAQEKPLWITGLSTWLAGAVILTAVLIVTWRRAAPEDGA